MMKKDYLAAVALAIFACTIVAVAAVATAPPEYRGSHASVVQEEAAKTANAEEMSEAEAYAVDPDAPPIYYTSFEDLAKQYLGKGSQMTVTSASSGTFRYHGDSGRKMHCMLDVNIASHETDALESNFSIEIENSLGDMALSGKENVRIEATCTPGETVPFVSDKETHFRINRATFDALATILQYYAGSSDYGAYLEDPLADFQPDADANFSYTYETY